MMNASLSLLILLWTFPGQCQAQTQAAITSETVNASQNDLAAMRVLMEEISVDPNNQRTRSLLRDLWQENLRKREEALEQGLKVSGELGTSSETYKQLSQALEALRSSQKRIAQKEGQIPGGANPDAGMFLALVRGAADSYEQGRQEEAFLVLTTALSLYPAWSGALPLSGKSPPAEPSRNIRLVKISTKTLAPFLAAGATFYAPVTPEDAESARQHFRAGIRFYSAGELAQAARSFREGLARDPNNEWIKKALARTTEELKFTAENAPSMPAPQPPASEPTRYLVQKGDTLSKLAQRFYGDPLQWEVIRDANPQLQGRLELTSGASLVIPPLAAGSPRPSARQRRASPDIGTIKHEVREGDTLRKLAKKYYGNPAYWEVIWRANPEIKDENALKAGATLVIPPLPKTSTRHEEL